MDRSIGTLRELRELGIADNTLLVFCSDNGGLPGITPETVGQLRGNKGSVYEGGLRVPGIIEWPAVIQPRVTHYPACTMDLFPTVADILGLPDDVMVRPVDGISLKPLLTAMIDGRFKILSANLGGGKFEVYDLESDPKEIHDLSAENPALTARLREALLAWNSSVENSVAGKDYAEGRVIGKDPPTQPWLSAPEYQPNLKEWQKRREYQGTASASKQK
jgi:hypothetical protein